MAAAQYSFLQSAAAPVPAGSPAGAPEVTGVVQMCRDRSALQVTMRSPEGSNARAHTVLLCPMPGPAYHRHPSAP